MKNNRFLNYVTICERAESIMPELKKYRVSNMMDIESADIAFNLRLNDWIKSDNVDFMHDFLGIINESNRDTFPSTFGMFVPRFSCN